MTHATAAEMRRKIAAGTIARPAGTDDVALGVGYLRYLHGVFARSTKEGQYYLMPLFLVTMPLIGLTLAPGVELNAFYSMVPVTGVALLLQKLMAAGTPAWEHGLYVGPVLAPMIIYSWLALRWAIDQFNREEVLFREAERLDIRLWVRRLLREKELLPTLTDPRLRFQTLVTAHVLEVVARELMTEEDHLLWEWEWLAELLDCLAPAPPRLAALNRRAAS